MKAAIGLEAGQSAVGDIFNRFVREIKPWGGIEGSHEALSEKAKQLLPDESGLLALDWHNGNRTILVDQRLTGLILGLTLHTEPAEIYQALIEARAEVAKFLRTKELTNPKGASSHAETRSEVSRETCCASRRSRRLPVQGQTRSHPLYRQSRQFAQ
ncbi:L-ribulokinase [Candidatus Fervidibacter sacchari]|uniref:L-ribulokinase n=1 Tax=Candidatus Fervidibacter sacchari TaxID=1448929 RepID=A0ABT2EMN6_9BACT|nr:L-ribulokinase [Candidatus Fervidibacter sacchari]